MFEIIHDAEKDVAALIDSEFGRALGPIAMGEKAVHLLETFAGAHGVDPATIPTPELEGRWKEFVSALSADVTDVEGEARRVADEVLGNSAHAGAPAGEKAPTDPTAGGEQAPAGGAQSAESTTTPGAPPAPAEQSPSETTPGPVTTAEPGHVICPTCDGWREVSIDGVVKPCPTCDGKGEIPTHEDAAAQAEQA